MNTTHSKNRFVTFIKEHKWILLIMLLMLIERIIGLCQLGPEYSLSSDDSSYVNSGIVFANTGTITMHGILSAQIMPGMTVFIALFSLIFGEGTALWLSLKIAWICMGILTPFFVYKCVTIFTPKIYGLIAAAFFFAPNFVWMDNLILTETPFMLLFVIMIYGTLMMGRNGEKKYFWLTLVTYMLALMLKANIGIYPLFAFIYLLLVKYDFKTLLKQGCILAGAVLCFVIPWSIRNYIHYDAFIPLTYGSGNPALMGTYQGENYPADEDLDYVTNVEMVSKEKFSKYYNDDGTIEPYLEKYVLLETDGIKANYRMSEWFKNDPKSMIKSYLFLKPKDMIEQVFYWNNLFNCSKEFIEDLRILEFKFSVVILFLALIIKDRRKEMFFMWFLYFGNLYIYAMTYAYSRYAETLMPVRYIALGIGLFMTVRLFKEIFGYVKEKIRKSSVDES